MSLDLQDEVIIDKEDTREGIQIEKGVILTEDRINKNYELYTKYISFFTAYPDLFIDLITPKESHFKLFPYQRIFLRASLRYRYHYCTAPRAFAKSFLSILAMYLRCIFLPGSKVFICAPRKRARNKNCYGKTYRTMGFIPYFRKRNY